MADGKKLIRILYLLFVIFLFNNINLVMAEKPYHHLQDGTFRNPEGSPKRDPNNGKIYFLAGDSLWIMEKK